jgi:recombination protein RecA
MSKDKTKTAVDKAFDKVDFLYARGAIVNLSANPRYAEKSLTDRPSIDYVTDGGFPRGRLILIAGEPSAGKSSLTIQIAEKLGDRILYGDTEATLTTDYLESLGATPSKFDHFIPETTESLSNIVREQIPNYDVIVIDSINNSASGEQLQKTAEEKTMANRANVLSSQLPIWISLANQYNTTIIVLSQIRDNMNKANKYSPDTIIPGGNSLHHNSSLTLELFKSSKKEKDEKGTLGNKDKVVEGNMVRIKCTKNKVGVVNREVSVEFTYGKGYTIEADVASSAKRLGVLEMKGSWVSYKGTNLCQGIDNLVPLLLDNPELLDDLKLAIKEKTESGK